MRGNSKFKSIATALDLLGAAFGAASAVERGRQPDANHLRRLGIDPVEFAKIERR